ncbi:GNAT family N-acetyltransferase [Desulfosarcina sp.]|uniref:GNAT family N-acetyltransferase n=1 Tax=Desulfosarcina sp. TaxID=2027861 RepID=UPI003569CFB4
MGNPAASCSDMQNETLESMATYWKGSEHALKWSCPFVLPPWLSAWWPLADGEWSSYVRSIYHQGQLAGIAPLMRKGRESRLIGDADVCDHLDVVVAPAHAKAFSQGLLDGLARDGIRRLVLSPVRQDSSVMTHLIPVAESWGARVDCDHQAQLFAMSLPDSWEGYLQRLSGKARHEIRRKLRRLDEAGRVVLRCIGHGAELPAAMQTFFTLFRANRSDKATFMNEAMMAFFLRLAKKLADDRLLKLYFLDLDGRPIAATLCIDDRSTVYLYNNGYDEALRSLSVGQLSKVLTIKASIGDGRQTYDFLKGSEAYKRRLGGQPVNLHHCVLDIE